ncbi:MAG: uroporphyrinogen decarboxylase [Planctomycetota bacterium]
MNDLFLRACRCEPTERTPVWLMRQAGRYLPEYRELRKQHDFLTLTRTPDLAAEVTIQPIRRFGFDAAILFADIMTPLVGHGIEIDFAPGPVVAKPFRDPADVARLKDFEAETAVPDILETIRILKRELDVPLIGFAGAPWTLMCYLVDGQGTKDYPLTRTMLYRDEEMAWDLAEAMADMVAAYAKAQVEAGADAVQVFDTWAGLMPVGMYLTYAVDILAPLHQAIREMGVPVIHYSSALSGWPGFAKAVESDVVAVDWRVGLDHVFHSTSEKFGKPERAIQGNLDPMALFAPPDRLREEIRDILTRVSGWPGHIFNLGHGLHKDTPIESVEVLVETVREETVREEKGR